VGTLTDEKRDATRTHYRRNRYVDPATGRFTQEDPIGLAGGLSVYGFADGDAVSYSDPFGLLPIPLLIAGAIALFEAASTAYDAYQAGKTIADPNASTREKLLVGGGAAAGVWLPGPGTLYAKAGKTIFKSRNAALRAAKRANNIPVGRQPNRVYKTVDKHTGEGLDTYEFTNDAGELIEMRVDRPRSYPDGGSQGSHINAGKKGEKLRQHYEYEP
jgi:RHS repeat-associated protein